MPEAAEASDKHTKDSGCVNPCNFGFDKTLIVVTFCLTVIFLHKSFCALLALMPANGLSKVGCVSIHF